MIIDANFEAFLQQMPESDMPVPMRKEIFAFVEKYSRLNTYTTQKAGSTPSKDDYEKIKHTVSKIFVEQFKQNCQHLSLPLEVLAIIMPPKMPINLATIS